MPITAPLIQTMAASASVTNASGTMHTSGVTTSASYSGPWLVEEQGLQIDYHRVPGGRMMSETTTLSSVSVSTVVTSTQLVCEITAYYKSTKDWGEYDTSNWSQPQTFQFIGFSADAYGQTYGAMTASTLGPMGSIVTNQAYYRRVPWNTVSGATETTKFMRAANYYAVNLPTVTSISGVLAVDPATSALQTDYNTDFAKWLIPNTGVGPPGTITYSRPYVSRGNATGYTIPGIFSTSQESLPSIFIFMNNIGVSIRDESLYGIPATIDANGADAIKDQGFPEYNHLRHDYRAV